MPKCYLLILALFLSLTGCKPENLNEESAYPTPFENSNGNETATYQQTMEFYMQIAREFPSVNLQTIGNTDSGLPLHLVTFNKDGDFNFKKFRPEKTILLIVNGIHPGESDGIDATMLLFRDLAEARIDVPENTVLVTIPIYNVGGSLNRNSSTRVNQNGPSSYGFRGNALNYDLNRDFIKSDSKNSQTFSQIFHLLKPDVFIDTHVSNGADYQYNISHLFTQHDKLGGSLGDFLIEKWTPEFEESMEAAGWPVTPYVNVFNRPPDNGFVQFLDFPRYSTGYAALWNSLGIMIETHMFKSYATRVDATYQALYNLISLSEKHHPELRQLREDNLQMLYSLEYYPLQWEVDSTRTNNLEFRGYQADTLLSDITGKPRIQYDKEQPFSKSIVYYNRYKPSDSVRIPSAYLIEKAWEHIIRRLEQNDITYEVLQKDTILEVESYRIGSFETVKAPYEGHYLHYGTAVESEIRYKTFLAGDYLVPTDQEGIRYLLETLEPEAVDSFFNWNMFDQILQRKEGFSPYVFEEVAVEILENDESLRDSFLLKKETDENFREAPYEQLQFIYERSEYAEPVYRQYPVYRLMGASVNK